MSKPNTVHIEREFIVSNILFYHPSWHLISNVKKSESESESLRLSGKSSELNSKLGLLGESSASEIEYRKGTREPNGRKNYDSLFLNLLLAVQANLFICPYINPSI